MKIIVLLLIIFEVQCYAMGLFEEGSHPEYGLPEDPLRNLSNTA
jgi:hypothetical protein